MRNHSSPEQMQICQTNILEAGPRLSSTKELLMKSLLKPVKPFATHASRRRSAESLSKEIASWYPWIDYKAASLVSFRL